MKKKSQLNQKIEAVTLRTLVAGIDIAKEKQWARFVDCRGVERGKAMYFRNVNANLKMSIFAETKCNFSPVSTEVYTALIHQFTCRFEARQALIYQLVLGLTGENGKYNYSRAVHVYPLFFDITCSAKNYKIAPALTLFMAQDL